MAFLYNQLSRKILLSLILLWGAGTFLYVNIANLPILIMLGVISLLGVIFIWTEKAPIFLLILLSFTSAYAFYTSLFQLGLPLSLVMIAIIIIYSYLFTYTEQKIGILGNKRLIYLVLFSLILLEVFLALSYFLINPISQSLVIATFSYLFVGFCYTILAKHEDNRFLTYILVTLFVLLFIFLTSTWGGLV